MAADRLVDGAAAGRRADESARYSRRRRARRAPRTRRPAPPACGRRPSGRSCPCRAGARCRRAAPREPRVVARAARSAACRADCRRPGCTTRPGGLSTTKRAPHPRWTMCSVHRSSGLDPGCRPRRSGEQRHLLAAEQAIARPAGRARPTSYRPSSRSSAAGASASTAAGAGPREGLVQPQADMPASAGMASTVSVVGGGVPAVVWARRRPDKSGLASESAIMPRMTPSLDFSTPAPKAFPRPLVRSSSLPAHLRAGLRCALLVSSLAARPTAAKTELQAAAPRSSTSAPTRA
jgi:hypothetical protein